METTETLKKPTMMARLRNSKGFSLIEMAIVLVIIGIIIAAIIKGQDLMLNSRAKQLISTANTWKIDAYSFMDRNGRFPGDNTGIANKPNGIIGDDAATEQVATYSATTEIVTALSSVPANPVMIGGTGYWFYFGNVNDGLVPIVDYRNIIVICADATCTNPLSPDGLEMMKALDTAIDGTADAGTGQIRAITTAGLALTPLVPPVNGRDNAVANITTTAFPNNTPLGIPSTWGSVAQYGAVWSFDKPF